MPVHVTIFSTGGKFWLVSNFTKLHALILATCSLLARYIMCGCHVFLS